MTESKKLPCIGLLITGIVLIAAGVVCNPSFVAGYLSPDGVLDKPTVVRIHILEALIISFGFIVALYSTIKITNSVFAIKIEEVFSAINPFPKVKMPKFIKIFFLADFVFALPYMVNNFVLDEQFVFLNKFTRIGGEASLPTWHSSMQLFLIAMFLAIFAYHKFERKDKESWILTLMSIVFFGLSLDQVAKINDNLATKISLVPSGEWNVSIFIFSLAAIWFLTGLMLFLLGIGARRYLQNGPYISRRYIIGWIIFIGSASGIEILQYFVRGHEILQPLKIFCHGLGEMLGGTVLLWATYDLLISYSFKLDVEG